MANIEELQEEIKYNNAIGDLRKTFENDKSKFELQCEYAIKLLRINELNIAADAIDCMLKKLAKEVKDDKEIIENDGEYYLRPL